MFVRTLNFQISVAKWKNDGGGIQQALLDKAETKLNLFLNDLELACHHVVDIKVNHYTVDRHNNGGCDEIWVQYTILYK